MNSLSRQKKRSRFIRVLRQTLLCAVFGLGLAIPVSSPVWADYTVTGNETYDDTTMTGKITIAEGAVLTSSGAIPSDRSLAGSGTWVSSAEGNVYYGVNSPDMTEFTGTIKVASGGRWMATNSTSYINNSNITMDVSDNAQVWINSPSVLCNFNLHDQGNAYDTLGLIRFDTASSTISGNIQLTGDVNISVRKDYQKVTNTISGVISGTGKLIKEDKSVNVGSYGTLVLTGENTYSGGTLVAEHVLELQGSGTLGQTGTTVTINTNSNKIGSTNEKRSDGILSINKTSDYTFAYDLAGNGTIQQNGTGKLTFASPVTTSFGGTVEIHSGTLNFGTLDNVGTFNYFGGSVEGSATANSVNVYDAALVYGSSVSEALLDTQLTGGKISINKGSSLSVTTADDLASAYTQFTMSNGGVLKYSGSGYEITDENSPLSFPETIEIASAGTLNCASGTGTISVAADKTVTFSAGMNESVAGQSLTKTGAGTLVLSAANYTGKTTVSEGLMRITADMTTATGKTFDIAPGASLTTLGLLNGAVITGTSGSVWNMVFFNADETSPKTAGITGFTGTINMSGTGPTRWRLTDQSVDWSNVEKTVIGSNFELYLKSSTFKGNLELGYSSGYDSAAGIRIDSNINSVDSVLDGTLVLRNDESGTPSINLKNSGANLQLKSVISGDGGLVLKADVNTPNTFRISATNSYTGATTIATATVNLIEAGTLGSGGVNVGNGATLNYDRTDASTLAGKTVNEGTINVNSGTFTTSGEMENKNTINVNAGTFAPAGTVTNTGTINVNSGAQMDIAGAFSTTGAVTNNGTITVTDTGSITVTGTGTIAVAAGAEFDINGTLTSDTNTLTGSFKLGNNGVLNTSKSVTFSNSTKITGNGTWNLTFINGNSEYANFADVSDFDGTINLFSTKSGEKGSRWMFENETVDFSGLKKITLGNDSMEIYMKSATFKGNLELGYSTGYDTGAGIRIDSNINSVDSVLDGTLVLRNDESGTPAINLKNSGANLQLKSVISGDGGLVLKADVNTPNTFRISATNSYTGATTITTATVNLIEAGTLGSGGLNVGNGATLNYDRNDASTLAGKTVNDGTINVNSGTFTTSGEMENKKTINVNAGTFTPAGTVTNTGTINVNFGAQMDIAGAFSTTGAVTNSGSITVTDTGSITVTGAGSITVADGAEFDINGTLTSDTNTLTGSFKLGNNGVLNTSKSITFSNSTKITGDGTWNMTFINGDSRFANFADVSDFDGTINLFGTKSGNSGSRWMFENETVDFSGLKKITLGNDSMEIYMKNSTLTADLAIGYSTGYDSGAAIRTDSSDSGSTVLNGSLTLLADTANGNATISAQNNNDGNDLLINSSVSGVGSLTLKGSGSKNGITLASDEIAYDGKTTIDNVAVNLAAGARMQAAEDITLKGTDAVFSIDSGSVLSIGKDTATAPTTISIIGQANTKVNLDGGIELSIGLDDNGNELYDVLDMSQFLGTLSIGENPTIYVSIGDFTPDEFETYSLSGWMGEGYDIPDELIQAATVKIISPQWVGWLGTDGSVNFGNANHVPEPSTWAMILLGLAGIWFVGRKKYCK